MIITEQVLVRIGESNYIHYEELGYNIAIGDVISVPTSFLSSGSHYMITCKCDMCGTENQIMYKNYLKYKNDWGDYTCRPCSEDKRKLKLKETFGVEYPSQDEKTFEKIKQTRKDKYGTEILHELKTKKPIKDNSIIEPPKIKKPKVVKKKKAKSKKKRT